METAERELQMESALEELTKTGDRKEHEYGEMRHQFRILEERLLAAQERIADLQADKLAAEQQFQDERRRFEGVEERLKEEEARRMEQGSGSAPRRGAAREQITRIERETRVGS